MVIDSMLIFYRAMSQIASKLIIDVEQVKNVIIWGNHSSTQFPDATYATAGGKPVTRVTALIIAHDPNSLK